MVCWHQVRQLTEAEERRQQVAEALTKEQEDHAKVAEELAAATSSGEGQLETIRGLQRQLTTAEYLASPSLQTLVFHACRCCICTYLGREASEKDNRSKRLRLAKAESC